jgi:hypothetical protein
MVAGAAAGIVEKTLRTLLAGVPLPGPSTLSP